jgi:hypothetical protein
MNQAATADEEVGHGFGEPEPHWGCRLAFGGQDEFGRYGNLMTTLGADKSPNEERFVIDSGATDHMVRNQGILSSYEQFAVPRKVKLGNDGVCLAYGQGNLAIDCYVDEGKKNRLDIHKAIYVPDLRCNMLSVKSIGDHGNSVVFKNNRAKILTADGKLLGTGSWKNRYCILNRAKAVNVDVDIGNSRKRKSPSGTAKQTEMKLLRGSSWDPGAASHSQMRRE